jgi:Ca2+-binding EF-hand superfamily protein
MKEYAVKLVKQYDKNNDNMLQPEERKELRGHAADSDLNHDGTITIDELVAHLSNPSPTTATAASGTDSPANGTSNSSGSSGDRDRGGYGYRRRDGDSGSDRGKSDADKALAGRVFTGTAGGSAASTKEGDKRRTYRFTRPADRLPATLPSWFKSRDTNGDGQVSMSEYSRSWSTSAVSEFRRYDQNDDGIITAKEAAKKP